MPNWDTLVTAFFSKATFPLIGPIKKGLPLGVNLLGLPLVVFMGCDDPQRGNTRLGL